MSINKHHNEAEVFFDRIADDYATRSEGKVFNTSSLSFARRQEIVESAIGELPTDGVVVDYGMGPAVFAECVVKQGCKYVGIDISQKMIDMAKARGLKGCTFKKGDLESLGEFADLADEVLLIGLIDYLDDPQEGLRVLGSCVKPGGSIILSFRNKFSIPFFLRETSKKIWRRLKGASAETARAFDADVLENAFSSRRDLVPFLKSVGFTHFEVRFLDASYAVVDSVFDEQIPILGASIVDTEGKLQESTEESNTANFPVEKLDNLSSVSFMQIIAKVITSDGGEPFVKIYSEYKLDFKITLEADFRINTSEL
jgi:SAM-dependent methyltransferase